MLRSALFSGGLMTQKMQHLVFYDGECGLCDQTVQFLLKQDRQKQFVFAPLQGTTAQQYLKNIPLRLKTFDSVILIENYKSKNAQIYVMSKAIFRMLWLLGGVWALIGWLSFLPAFLFDWGYRLVARNRHRLFPQTNCELPDPQNRDRFFP